MSVLQFFREGHLCKHQTAKPAPEEVGHDGAEHSEHVTAPGHGGEQTVANSVHGLDRKEKTCPEGQHLLPLLVRHASANGVEENTEY